MNEGDDLEAEVERIRLRSGEATANGGQAFARLFNLAETCDSGQIRRIVQFIASTDNGNAFPFDLFELRGLDVAIGDDMLLCLDALCWAKSDLHQLVPDGGRRVETVIARLGLQWPEAG